MLDNTKRYSIRKTIVGGIAWMMLIFGAVCVSTVSCGSGYGGYTHIIAPVAVVDANGGVRSATGATGVTATPDSHGYIHVAWDSASNPPSGWRVYVDGNPAMDVTPTSRHTLISGYTRNNHVISVYPVDASGMVVTDGSTDSAQTTYVASDGDVSDVSVDKGVPVDNVAPPSVESVEPAPVDPVFTGDARGDISDAHIPDVSVSGSDVDHHRPTQTVSSAPTTVYVSADGDVLSSQSKAAQWAKLAGLMLLITVVFGLWQMVRYLMWKKKYEVD